MSDLRNFPVPAPERRGIKRVLWVAIVLAVIAGGGAYVYENQPKPAPKPAVANDRLPSF